MIKKCKELCNKIRNSISSITKNIDEKYMKTKLNSDDDLPLNKTLEIRSMIIVVRSVFYESNKIKGLCFNQISTIGVMMY